MQPLFVGNPLRLNERNNMFDQLKSFRSDESGAVTVDWVVLTAAVCGLAIASFAAIQQGSKSVGSNVNEYLVDKDVKELAGIDS